MYRCTYHVSGYSFSLERAYRLFEKEFKEQYPEGKIPPPENCHWTKEVPITVERVVVIQEVE